MTTAQLKKTVKKLPRRPGIYLFKDFRNNPLYIGKALDLKNRAGHYLKINDVRLQKMVTTAKKLRHIQTKSDIEALIIESQLIKKFRPRFNIMMRDDKQYFYVGFSNDYFPKLIITHQPTIFNFVGPFTDGNTLKSTLHFLRRIFPYCTCKKPHNNFCLNYHIGKCPGFCCLKQQKWITDLRSRLSTGSFNPTIYSKNVAAIRSILTGKKNSVIKNLEKEMARSAKKSDLEKAIELREKLKGLKRVFENAKIIQKSSHTHISIYGYEDKNGKAGTNLIKILGLPKMPIRIEGYDVSNIQGAHATGSMVTFIRGQPDKNFYRKFKIYTKQSPNDTAMLKEVLERRFKHEGWPFPDLILVDGGKGQVNAARATLAALKISIPIIGISKNKHHLGHQLIIPGRKTPLPLTKLSPADRNLLLAIDSEAHRFAIGYYRKLHRKLFK